MAQRLDIDHARFGTAMLAGYDMEQVDTFLEDAKAHLAALEIALRTGLPLPPELTHPRFRWAVFQESYLTSDVRRYIVAICDEEDALRRTPRYATTPHGFAGRRGDPPGPDGAGLGDAEGRRLLGETRPSRQS